MSENSNESTDVKTKDDLPPPREKEGIRPVSPPLSKVSFRRFNSYLAMTVVLVLAFYVWRLTIWKADAGGWWNLVTGRSPSGGHSSLSSSGGPEGTQFGAGKGDMTVQQRISELASALGVPSKDLASAIASAVHEYVPPATLSSVAAHQSGDAVRYLVDPETASASDASASQVIPGASKGLKAAAKAFEVALGMDEPPGEMA